MIRAIQRQHLAARVSLHRIRMAAVGAGRSQHLHVARHHRAIALHAHLQIQNLRMAAARHVELLLARELHLHGTPRGHGQRAADILQQHLLLAAKAAADTRLDHVHAAHWNLQDHRDLPPAMVRHLRAGADHQTPIRIQPADRDVRFQHAMLLPAGAELALDDKVRFEEPLVHISNLAQNVARDVARGVVDLGGVRLIVNYRRARRHRLLHVEHGGEYFPLHFDQPDRLFGQRAALRRHRRHAISYEAHLGIQQVGIVGRGLRPCLPRGGVRHARHVFVGEHRVHARQRLRLARIDAFDARMRVRARHDLAPEHARHLNIVRERGGAGHELDPVHLAQVLFHYGAPAVHDATSVAAALRAARRRFIVALLAGAAASTASTGFR